MSKPQQPNHFMPQNMPKEKRKEKKMYHALMTNSKMLNILTVSATKPHLRVKINIYIFS